MIAYATAPARVCTVRAAHQVNVIRASTVAPPPPLRARLLGAAVAGVVALSAAEPALAFAGLELGEQVFEQSCAVCHAGGLNNIAGEEKHTLKKDALLKYNLYSEEAIAGQVTRGKDAMPPFEGVLSKEEIEAVAAYVFRQAAGDLWP